MQSILSPANAARATPVRFVVRALVVLAVALSSCKVTLSSAQEIRFARQTSIIFLQLYVIEDQKLVEKHAEKLGLKNVKTTWATFNGANMMNDALISGNVDVVTGGLTGMLILWDKTRGTPREVRGIATFASSPLYLNTWRPELRSIRDITADDRISLTAAKVSAQATLLQMATAKEFGDAEYAKFDPLVIAASPADATIALISKSPSTTLAFSTPPFQEYQVRQPGIHTVVDSFAIVGGPHTSGVAWTTAEFRDKNPLLYKALLNAWQEATDIINRDKRAAAAFYVKKMGSVTTLDIAEEVVTGPQMHWTMTPQNTLKFAQFLQRTGVIKSTAQSWKDYFFSDLYELPGS